MFVFMADFIFFAFKTHYNKLLDLMPTSGWVGEIGREGMHNALGGFHRLRGLRGRGEEEEGRVREGGGGEERGKGGSGCWSVWGLRHRKNEEK